MKEHVRNVVIGLTVIGALVLMGAMIVIFAGLPQMFQRGYRVRILLDSTHDAHEGDPVHLRGMRVGRVTRVEFTEGDPRKGVTITARINPEVNLPGNTQGYVYTKGFAGGAYIELKPEGDPRIDEKTGAPIEYLPRDGSVVLEGSHFGTELLPRDLKEDLQAALRDFAEMKEVSQSALREFASLAKNLNELLGGTEHPPSPRTRPAAAQPTRIRATLSRLDEALEAIASVLGDAENQVNIKTSLKNLTDATGKTARAMDSFNRLTTDTNKTIKEVARNLITTTERISAAMATINETAEKLESGQGTAGKLLNDPKLYNNLVDMTQQMERLLKELRQAVKTWKAHGVPIKLK